MVKHDHVILGVHVTDRIKKALEVQKLFSKYGQHIRTRLGLHQVYADRCVPGGIILIEMVGDRKRCDELAEKLDAIEGVEVKRMVFSHKHA
jgi:metal-responsive CopG/Arc/MetJ family transcriptional regulator